VGSDKFILERVWQKVKELILFWREKGLW